MKLKIAILFSILLLSSCLNKTKHLSTISRNGYSISYDSDLRLDETGKGGAELTLLIPKEDIVGGFAENFNLLIQDLANTGIDLNEFVEMSENQFKEGNSKLVESKRCKLGGEEAQKLVVESEYNGFELKYLQYYVIKNEKAYILTYSAKKTHFDKYLDKMDAAMNSFRVQ